MPKLTDDQLHQQILLAMNAEVKRIIEEEAQNAAKKVEERVRGMTGQIATKVASWVEYTIGARELRITVRFPDRDTTP